MSTVGGGAAVLLADAPAAADRPLTILFVQAAAEFSTADVGRGYARALRRLGHQVVEFGTPNRLKYHALALRNSPRADELANDLVLISRLACESIVVEALRERADLVIVTAGAGIHPDGLELCNRAGFPVGVIFTESPYEDDIQVGYSAHCGHVFTNDLASARRYGWKYLGSAFDPEIHRPRRPSRTEACDVLVLGTGWLERQQLLEAVDWTGIKLRVIGTWAIDDRSPLAPFYEEGCIDNAEVPVLYSSAKICINQHRGSAVAESLNPRAYELAGCGALQVSDWRLELNRVFGGTVPHYRNAAELESLIRCYLRMPSRERRAVAAEQRTALLRGRHSFDDRAAQLMTAITG